MKGNKMIKKSLNLQSESSMDSSPDGSRRPSTQDVSSLLKDPTPATEVFCCIFHHHI